MLLPWTHSDKKVNRLPAAVESRSGLDGRSNQPRASSMTKPKAEQGPNTVHSVKAEGKRLQKIM